MYVYCVYLLCIYKDTHMQVYISEKNYVYILNICIYNINYMNINIDMYIHVNIFKIYIVCVCIYIYIIYTYNIYTEHTHIQVHLNKLECLEKVHVFL